jgi:hypothetical protein
MKPSKGPRIRPFIGLITKIHPNHTPAERDGVTIISSTVDNTAKVDIKAMRLVLLSVTSIIPP